MTFGERLDKIEPGLRRLLEECDSVEENLRILIGPKFISLDDLYSLKLLDVFARKHWNKTVEELLEGMWATDVPALIDIELRDRGLAPAPQSPLPSGPEDEKTAQARRAQRWNSFLDEKLGDRFTDTDLAGNAHISVKTLKSLRAGVAKTQYHRNRGKVCAALNALRITTKLSEVPEEN